MFVNALLCSCVHLSVHSSRQILLPWHLKSGLSNLNETYRKYSLATTDDLIRIWRSKVKVITGRRGFRRHPCWRWGVKVHLLDRHKAFCSYWLVAWHSGRTSVCDRRTFPVLHLTCSWWMTYVCKPSATRSANSVFHPFKVYKWVVSCNQMCATSLRWCHLVNAYGVKAGWFIPFVNKHVGGR